MSNIIFKLRIIILIIFPITAIAAASIFIILNINNTSNTYPAYFDSLLEENNFDIEEVIKMINTSMNEIDLCIAIDDFITNNDLAEHHMDITGNIISEKYKNDTIHFEYDLYSPDYFVDSLYWTHFSSYYVVNLIERHSHSFTSILNWKYNYDYLKQYYDELIEFDNMDIIKKTFIDSYIENHYYSKLLEEKEAQR